MVQIRFRFYSILFLVALGMPDPDLYSQATVSLHFEALSINEGLSQGFVSSITQDSKGYMWFATSDGLNKYDGYRFTVYHHDPLDPASLADDDIACIYEDKQERLWICLRKGGIELFDRENLRFYHIRKNTTLGSPAGNEYSITEGKDGVLWIQTPQGIDRMVVRKKSTAATNESSFSNTHTIQLTHMQWQVSKALDTIRVVPRIFADNQDRVFVSNASTLYQLHYNESRQTFTLTNPQHFKNWTGWKAMAMVEDTLQRVLYVHSDKGVFRLPNGRFGLPQEFYEHRKYVGMWDLWGLDRNGDIWINEDSSIIRLKPNAGTWERIVADNSAHINLTKHAFCFYTDRSGILWIGTSGYGILKYDPGRERFHAILPGQYVYRIFQNKEGKIVFKDLYQLAIGNGTAATVQPLIDEKMLKRYDAFASEIYTCQDRQGAYWFSLRWLLLRYEPLTKDTITFAFPPGLGNTSEATPVADRNNNIWMSTAQYLLMFNTTTHSFTKHAYPVQTFANDFLQVLKEEGDGIFILGTKSGILRFNSKTGSWNHWLHSEGDTTTLSNDFVLSFCDDPINPTRYLWVGTRGGLSRMDKVTGRFRRYTTRNGLPNNVIYGVLADRQGTLWLSTNNGIAHLNPLTGAVRMFNVADGLQANEFNRYAYYKTREGLLVFGGVNGLNYFDPQEMQSLPPPDVMLTDFRLFNQSVDFKMPNAPLKKDIAFTKSLTLNYTQNMFTLQFAAMDYRKAGNVRYRYRMKGFDKRWIYTGTGREATYTNLDPGTYVFMVEGSNSDGVWGGAQNSLTIQIVPPWWRTWWFYTMAAIFTTGFIYSIYRYRVNQLLKIERVRNRIAQDLHDEIGSSLSTISIYTKVVQSQLNNNPDKTVPLLHKISENANEMQEAMSDIVWSINPKNETFENLINRMREHAAQLFEAKGYILHFNFDASLHYYRFAMERRKDFYLIYKEALNNISKYAEGKNVEINLTSKGTDITLLIRDDGKGFDPAVQGSTGNGMHNMKSRAQALKGVLRIISAKGAGTTIQLDIPK